MVCRTWLSLVALIALPLSASAQMAGTTTGTSAFGNRTVGGTANLTGVGSNTLGLSSGLGATGTMGGMGGTGAIGGTGATSGLASGIGSLGGLGGQTAQGGFIGAGSGQGTFIGGQAANNTGMGGGQAGQMNRGAAGGRGGMLGGAGAFNQGRNTGAGNFGGAGRSSTVVLPTRLTIGFDFQPAAQPSILSEKLSLKFKAIKQFSGSDLSIQLQDRTAVLRGTVKTMADKQLAAQIVKLNPAVQNVVNELLVE
jgi:hypothetical protein